MAQCGMRQRIEIISLFDTMDSKKSATTSAKLTLSTKKTEGPSP